MNKDTRNRLQRATQAARALIEDEYGEQLEGTFDLRLDGMIPSEPGDHLDAHQRALWKKLVATIGHLEAGGEKKPEAVQSYLREAAFTTLNRFVAVKMLEARGLVLESVSQGDQSSGFKEFTGLAPGLIQLPDHGYRLYIESLFDEIGREVRVLFDRRDPASLLWVRRQALHDLLKILNAPELSSAWAEDETIGWIYQYFNGDEERSRMREESQAPRNSRELAVRNQFFTPRYVVQFLTDNTLGRTWYEMMQGDTQLAQLDYLVRRPNEVFLFEGESAPKSDADDSELSKQELLQQAVQVSFRAKKDPRDLRILDPACGSGHFLLYTFDLLIPIYEEAWADASAAAFIETGTQLWADYGSIDDLRRAMPELILRHNLHGVDIDPRAAQIAALALWMRAQRAYSQFEVDRAQRPPITKTNIVVAEPMPGDAELVAEFAASLKPAVLGDLFKKMVDEMELAGELGSLLKIEESIAKAVEKAEEAHAQEGLFAEKIEGKDFWDTADEKIIAALGSFAESAAGAGGVRRQLFAGDAAQGVAFIELMRKRFDAVLMNPPFGAPSEGSLPYFRRRYSVASDNLYVAFLTAAMQFTIHSGRIGALTDRSWLNKRYYGDFRRQELIPLRRLELLADLGAGVLDANVEVAAHTYTPGSGRTSFLNLLTALDKEARLRSAAASPESWSSHDIRTFKRFPDAAFVYDLAPTLTRSFDAGQCVSDVAFKSFGGLKAGSSTHLFRLHWEVPQVSLTTREWAYFQNGSPYCPYYYGTKYVVRCDEMSWATVRAYPSSRTTNSELYFRAGLFYGKRTDWMYAYVGGAGQVPSMEGHLITSHRQEDIWRNLLIVNSSVYQEVANHLCGQHKYAGYVNPIRMEIDRFPDWELKIKAVVARLLSLDYGNELSPLFVRPKSVDIQRNSHGGLLVFQQVAEWREGIANAANQVREDYDRVVEQEFQWAGRDRRAPASVDYVRHLFGESNSPALEAKVLISYLVGVAFGRWSIAAANSNFAPPLNADFALRPIPTTPFASGEDHRDWASGGLAATSIAEQEHRGIQHFLVLDAGHEDDAVRLMQDCGTEVLASKSTELLRVAVEHIAKTTSVSDLRGWLATGFFSDHVERYSRGKLKAPIYWQLATPSASYSVWCYYHRLTRDTFFRVANDYVTPKVDHEERKLNTLHQEAGPDPSSKQRKEIDAQDTLVAELRTFLTEVKRIAPLWNPNLNDGAIINFAPLWRLVPQHKTWQRECKSAWDKLCKGNYDWAHLAMHLWPERVAPKCAKDRILAIAHGLEGVFWCEDEDGKWQPKKVSDEEVADLVAERTSPAVKVALKSLLEAPAPSTGRGHAPRRKKATTRRTKAAAPSTVPAEPLEREPRQNTSERSIDATVLDQIRSAIATLGDSADRSDILDTAGLSVSQWTPAIDALLADGSVTKTGQKRGTRYHLAKNPS